nr:hypothetical protein Q903MT_gene4840 [Picea sitchensis]
MFPTKVSLSFPFSRMSCESFILIIMRLWSFASGKDSGFFWGGLLSGVVAGNAAW